MRKTRSILPASKYEHGAVFAGSHAATMSTDRATRFLARTVHIEGLITRNKRVLSFWVRQFLRRPSLASALRPTSFVPTARQLSRRSNGSMEIASSSPGVWSAFVAALLWRDSFRVQVIDVL